jgi:hypothetical protein
MHISCLVHLLTNIGGIKLRCRLALKGRGVYRVLVGKPEGKRPQGKSRGRYINNIKLDLMERGFDGANWIQLAQDKVQWGPFVNTLMNLRVP